MKNPRFAIFAVAVIAVGALVALVLFERHELWRAHTENLALREQAQNLTAQRKSLRPPFTEPEISVPAREKEFSELLRLRGEVGRLRLELSERGNGRSDVAQAPIVSNAAALPWRVAFGTELRDVGAATPERAANTLVWAALQGDRGRVADLLELPAGVSAEDAPQHYDFFTSALSNKFSHMEFTSIQSVGANPDGTLRLNQVYRDKITGEEHPFPFMLRQNGSVWRVIVEH